MIILIKWSSNLSRIVHRRNTIYRSWFNGKSIAIAQRHTTSFPGETSRVVQSYKQWDKIPQEYELIYLQEGGSSLKKLFYASVAINIFFPSYMIYYFSSEKAIVLPHFDYWVTVACVTWAIILGIAAHFVSKNYVQRIYYSPRTKLHKASFVSYNPLSNDIVTFQKAHQVFSDTSNVLGKDSIFKVNGRYMLAAVNNFITSEAYYRMFITEQDSNDDDN